MSKFAIKANALGDGDLTLEIPEMAVDQTLEFPPEGGRLARADAADGMPLMSDGTPVVESGSNSDGEWVKWGDGTQLCGKNGHGTGGSSWAYPVPFIAAPAVNATAETANLPRFANVSSSRTATNCGVWAFTDTGASSGASATMQAYGRWK